MVNDLHLWIDNTERRKTERKKENVPNQHSQESACKVSFYRERRPRNTFFVILFEMTFPKGRLHRVRKD
jgi:hypothetical protein